MEARLRWTLGCVVMGGAVIGSLIYGFRGDSLPPGVQADRLVLDKSERTLWLYSAGQPLKAYRVALGRHPVGPKQCEGDNRTPEGIFRIDFHKRDSSFHRALHISYPMPSDIQSAALRGCSPGGDIMIHGLRNGIGFIGPIHRVKDWTRGCIAVTDSEIEELWRAVPDGTEVEIRP